MPASKLPSHGARIAAGAIVYAVFIVSFWTPDYLDKIVTVLCAVIGGTLWLIGYLIERRKKTADG